MFPASQAFFALIIAHGREKTSLTAPIVQDVLPALPIPNGQSCQVCGTQSGRFHARRAFYAHRGDIGLKLHQEVVGAGSAVNLEGSDGQA